MSPPRRSPARRLRRWFLFILLTGLGGVVLMRWLARPMLVREVTRALPPGAMVWIADVDLEGLHGLTATGIRVNLPRATFQLTVDTLRLDYSLFALFGTPRRIRQLQVAGPRLEIADVGSATPLLPSNSGRDSAAGRGLPEVAVESLNVRGGSIRARNRHDGDLFHATEVGLTGFLTLGAQPQAKFSPVILRVERSRVPRGPFDLEAELEFADGRFTVRSATARDTAGGRWTMAGTVGPGDAGRLRLDLQLEGRGISPALYDPMASPLLSSRRKADVKATAHGSVEEADVSGQVTFAGAGLVRTESRLALLGPVPKVEFRGDLQGLDLTALTEGRLPLPPLVGTIRARLARPLSDSISGSVRLELASASDTTIRTSGTAELASGVAAVALDVRVAHTQARLRGTVRPFDSTPSWDFEVTGRGHAPLPPWIANREPSWRGPWELAARARGTGLSLDGLQGQIDGRLEPAVPGPRSGSGILAGRIEAGRALFTARQELGGGEISGRGKLRLRAPLTTWEITALEVQGLGLGPWTTAGDSSRLFAHVTARGTPAGPAAKVWLDSITGGPLGGHTGALDIAVRPDGLWLWGDLFRDAAHIEIDTLTLARETVRRAHLRFHAVDPSVYVPAFPRANLTGRLVLAPLPDTAASDTTLAAWARHLAVRGRLNLESSTVLDLPLGGVTDLEVLGGRLHYNMELTELARSFTARGSARLSETRPSVEIEEVRFYELDLSRFLSGRGRTSGLARGTWEGTDPATARADAWIRLDTTLLGRATLDSTEFTLALADGQAHLVGSVTGAGRTGMVEASAEQRVDRSWSGTMTAVVADSSPGDTLVTRLRVGTPDSAGSGGWRLDLDARGGLAGIRIDSLRAAGEVRDRVLTLASLDAVGPELELSGSGRIPVSHASPTPAELRLDAFTTALPGLGALPGYPGLSGAVRLSLRSTGLAAALRHELRVAVSRFSSPFVRVDSAEVLVNARSDSTAWLATASTTLTAIGRDPILLSAGGLPVWAGPGLPAATTSHMPARVELTADWTAGDSHALRVTEVSASLGSETFQLTAPARIGWGDGLTLERFAVHSAAGHHASIDGRVAREGEQRLVVEVVGLPVQFRGVESGAIGGRLDLGIQLSGPAETPRLVASGQLKDDVAAKRPLTFDATWVDGDLRLRAERVQREGGWLLLTAAAPLQLSLMEPRLVTLREDSVEVILKAGDYDLHPLGPLLPRELRQLRGRVDADLAATGSTGAPTLRGGLTIRDFGLQSESYGTRLSAERLRLEMLENRIEFAEGVIQSERGGRLLLEGGVELPGRLDVKLGLDLTMQRFRAADSRTVAAVVSGRVAVRGTLRAPEVRGDVQVEEATYQLSRNAVPPGTERIELTRADSLEVLRRFRVLAGRSQTAVALWNRTRIDVAVRAPNKVWARRPYDPAMAVEVSVDVSATKEPDQALMLQGEINILTGRSYVEEFGRRFTITSGNLHLDGPIDAVQLKARADYDPTPDVKIHLDVEGNLEGFSLTLSSEPEMDNTDIVSYIAVGRPASEVQQVEDVHGDVAGLGAGVVLSRVSGSASELARRSLGLDVVEIRQDGIKGVTLAAGRYASRRLFIGFEQPVVFQNEERQGVGIDDTEVTAEYRVNHWLLANLSGSSALARFFLGVRHAY